jgi:hypothetical protein
MLLSFNEEKGVKKAIWFFVFYLITMVPCCVYSANPAKALPTYSVGDFAQGGVVFWLDPSQQHGLVCAIEEQSTAAIWLGVPGDVPLVFGAFANGVWMGGPNTQYLNRTIAELSLTGTFAPSLCSNYRGGGYSDWYLPSALEAALFYEMTDLINQVSTAHGGTALNLTGTYWTSTEIDGTHAYAENYIEAAPTSTLKLSLCRVRAIRAF